MEILRFNASLAERIGRRPYEVKLSSSIKIAEGAGEAHAYVLYFEPGGEIGAHEAGFGQILRAGDDGERVALSEGEAAFVRRGETHSKGSETGMTALMVRPAT